MPIAQILLASRSGTPPPTYTLTPATSSTDEGASLTFTVGGTNIVDGTYYWDITHSGTTNEDFTATSGTVTVTSNSGVFTVTPTADATTEGSETFVVALREGSTSGTILASSGSVTINDTSFAIGGQYVFNGTPTSWATTNATATTYGAYTYPDETSGSLHTLTGSEFLMSGDIGNNTVLNINLWFYPTANNVVIMGELGQPAENSYWHYSMLDIDSTNHLRGRLWELVGGVTSTGTVTLNAWNHAYLYYNSVTGYVGMSLNNETAVTTNTGTRHLPDSGHTYLGIGLIDDQNLSSNARYQGKFAAPVIDTTLTGSNYTSTKAKYIPPLSLVFNNPQQDYLSTPASADWNLGNNWTMEFWIRSNNNSASNINIPGGQWGLINQGGWYGAMPDDNCILVGMGDGYLSINQSANGDISFAEPTTQQWTHVAIVNNGGGSAQKVYYNGVEQTPTGANYTTNGKTNTTEALYIGRLKPDSGGFFDGKMALVRISNTAKYTAPFTATTTYGVEADTKLFLGSVNPLVDSMSHTITNNGVTISTDFPPASITITNVSVGFNSRAATVDFTANITQSETATIFFEWFSGAAYSGPYTLTVNPGSNTYTSPTLSSLSGSGSDLTTEITIASGANACTSNIYTGAWSVICLVEGTMVTMADGSYKAIEDIGYNDLIRVWNFDLGEFSEALPVFVKQEETHSEHYRFTFSDGTVLRTVGHHVFNKQAGAFTMLVRDTTPVGTITFNEFGEEVTLISKETIQEPVRFYNVWTQYHLNLFAQGILTSNRFNNIYPIQDMKFVKDNRALRPLEEFANIDPKYISGLRLQEQPAQYTAEYIRDYVENKLERLDIANTVNHVHPE